MQLGLAHPASFFCFENKYYAFPDGEQKGFALPRGCGSRFTGQSGRQLPMYVQATVRIRPEGLKATLLFVIAHASCGRGFAQLVVPHKDFIHELVTHGVSLAASLGEHTEAALIGYEDKGEEVILKP